MKLALKFDVVHRDGDCTFNLSKIGEATYKVSWKESGNMPAGSVVLHENNVRANITSGAWIVQDGAVDSFALRVAYFQQHIDAVEENLASLKKAFEELKQEVT